MVHLALLWVWRQICPTQPQGGVEGIIAQIDNPDITIDELMTHVKAPDFPTGGIIYGYEGVKEAFTQEEDVLFYVQKLRLKRLMAVNVSL
ncbi:MAG: hypothetical protein CM15mP32_2150 [Flavobacteriaceae bacterium]|nr:MAG: hypothetical protein CM15mP32_2150 [Flavobacteriaceae bacterium]